MGRLFAYLLYAIFLLGINASYCWAGSLWNIVTISTDRWLPDNITFRLDGYKLLLNNSFIYQPGGSSRYSKTLYLSGQWAVCGTIIQNQLIPDPYATFIRDSYTIPQYEIQYDEHGTYKSYTDVWTQVGHINWLRGTPHGYAANLSLGLHFEGDGGSTYTCQNQHWPETATGTIVLDTCYNFDTMHYYETLSNSHQVVYAPEPSCIVFLLCGIGSVALHKKKRYPKKMTTPKLSDPS